MKKRIGKALFFLALAGTCAMVGLIAWLTWQQYQDTRKWEQTMIDGELKDIPPFLARNYLSHKDRDALELWMNVKGILETVEQEDRVPEGDQEQYQNIWKQAVKKQEDYEITTGEVTQWNSRLGLYLELETALASAYEAPASETLMNLTNQLYEAELQKSCPLHAAYFGRLQETAKDYKNLSAFLAGEFPKLGAMDGKRLVVKTTVGPKITEQIKTAIAENGLQKFPFIDELYKRLEGGEWASLLRQTETIREYQKWKAAEEKLAGVAKNQYYGASTITTYQQALDAGLTVRVQEKEGFTVDINSEVEQITYEGRIVKNNQYIRYGTPVIVTIKETYIEIPKTEEPEIPPAAEEPGLDSGGTGEEVDEGWDNWEEDWGEIPKPKPEMPPKEDDWDEDW